MLFHGDLDMEMMVCSQCHRPLARLHLAPGSVVEIKCRSCKTFNTVRVTESTAPTGSASIPNIVPLRS